jgi:DNA-binding NarL/FixJ family response regulator
MKKIRIMLADDHVLVRAGFRLLLNEIPDIEVVAEAGEGYEVLRQIREKLPDIVLMDIAMPGLNGLEISARISKEAKGVHIIFVSMHDDRQYVMQALNVGAAGYVLKNADRSELELAIRSAMKGEPYLSPAVSKQLIDGYTARVREHETETSADLGGSPYEKLTPRQRQILQLIAEGSTCKEIAQKLNLSFRTVQVHRTQLMNRLNIHDTANLVRYAVKAKIVV